jgi:beta-galactosidase
VKFGLTGNGRLLDNLGTATGSRMVQLANGRAQIRVQIDGAKVVASVSTDGIDAEFIHLKKSK